MLPVCSMRGGKGDLLCLMLIFGLFVTMLEVESFIRQSILEKYPSHKYVQGPFE